MENFSELFSLVLDKLKEDLSETSYQVWFKDVQLLSFDDGMAVIGIPSFQRKIVEQQFMDQLKTAFEKALGFIPVLELVDAAKTVGTKGIRHTATEEPAATAVTPADEADNNFETFVVGGSNKFAYAAAQAVATNPGKRYNPLFIYGNSGLGKTHLLMAIRHAIARTMPDMRLVYTSGETFTNEMITYIEKKSMEQFHQKFRSADVLLVDDVQFIAGKEATQEEFFNTFNSLIQNGGQIVLCSDKPPKDLVTLDDRLRSRFERGLIADVQPPDLETRMAIIKRKAQRSAFNIPDDLVDYIARRIKNNIRQLEGAVNRLEAFVKLRGMQLNIVTAQMAIGDIINEERPLPVTIERIVEESARACGVFPAELRSRRRSADISAARQLAMYAISQVTGISTQQIGQEFMRDHSTVVYALKEVRNEMERDPGYKKKVNDVIKNAQDN